MVKYEPRLTETFGALSDPTRREILERLAHRPASVSELAQPFGLSLPGMLKHLRVLEEAGLVETRKEGRVRRCHLGPQRLDDAARWIDTYRRRWERRLDRFTAYVEGAKR